MLSYQRKLRYIVKSVSLGVLWSAPPLPFPRALGAPTRIHGSAVLLVDLVSSLVISFICSTGKEIVPVVGVLELVVRIDV